MEINNLLEGAYMRDKIMTKDYFNDILNYEEKRIAEFNNILEELLLKTPKDLAKIIKVRGSIINFLMNKIYILYSLGSSISDIKNVVRELARLTNQNLSIESNDNDLIILLSLVSLILVLSHLLLN